MNQKCVSIVIPVYNTERYLNRCIESIVNQTYRNLEIILIDDGSPDNCPQLCDEWAQRDERVLVIHKTNEGQGSARNTGISHASGEYICFFDSDDFVDLRTIEKAVCNAEIHRADIVCFGMHRTDSKGKVVASFVPCPERFLYEEDDIRNEFLVGLTGPDPQTGKKWNISMSAWGKLFSLDMIRKADWSFVSEREISGEDFRSVLKLCSYAKRISVIPEALYYYCLNTASITQVYRPERFEKNCLFYREIVALCDELGYKREIIDHMAEVYLSFVIATLKQEESSQRSILEKWASIKNIIDNDLLQAVLEGIKGKRVDWKKTILFWSIRKKKYLLCNVLLSAQNAFSK